MTSTPNDHHAPKRRTSAASTASGSSTGHSSGVSPPAENAADRSAPTSSAAAASVEIGSTRGVASTFVDEEVTVDPDDLGVVAERRRGDAAG